MKGKESIHNPTFLKFLKECFSAFFSFIFVFLCISLVVFSNFTIKGSLSNGQMADNYIGIKVGKFIQQKFIGQSPPLIHFLVAFVYGSSLEKLIKCISYFQMSKGEICDWSHLGWCNAFCKESLNLKNYATRIPPSTLAIGK